MYVHGRGRGGAGWGNQPPCLPSIPGSSPCPGPCTQYHFLTDHERRWNPWAIRVWEVATGAHVASLTTSCLSSVSMLAIVRSRCVLLSAHLNGEVHVWKYAGGGSHGPAVVHVTGCVVCPERTKPVSLAVSGDVVFASLHTSLIAFPVPGTEAHPPREGAVVLNCGACGRARVPGAGPNAGAKRCSGCHAVMFCDVDCQRRGWKAHKPLCRFLQSGATDVQALPLPKGCVVRLCGLATPEQQQYNGREGAVQAWVPEKGRYCVALGDRHATLKPCNLQLVWYNGHTHTLIEEHPTP